VQHKYWPLYGIGGKEMKQIPVQLSTATHNLLENTSDVTWGTPKMTDIDIKPPNPDKPSEGTISAQALEQHMGLNEVVDDLCHKKEHSEATMDDSLKKLL
jgi:hypothetical protein